MSKPSANNFANANPDKNFTLPGLVVLRDVMGKFFAFAIIAETAVALERNHKLDNDGQLPPDETSTGDTPYWTWKAMQQMDGIGTSRPATEPGHFTVPNDWVAVNLYFQLPLGPKAPFINVADFVRDLLALRNAQDAEKAYTDLLVKSAQPGWDVRHLVEGVPAFTQAKNAAFAASIAVVQASLPAMLPPANSE